MVRAWFVVLSLLPSFALANGQSTHLWITNRAVEQLPPGPLRELLTREDVRMALWNGTMFPDGGYAVGDEYGEMAHWEPFQLAYLRWIQANFEPPWDDPLAARHVAFFFGLRSHGMADEVFDCLFMERSRVEDDDGSWGEPTGLDTATDVMLVAAEGSTPVTESWYPEAAILSVFHDDLDYAVDPAVIAEGHERLFIALAFGEWAAGDGNRLPQMVADYPWTAEHFLSRTENGAPWDESRIVAAYWQREWARLQGDDTFHAELLNTTPDVGAYRHGTDATQVTTRLQMTFTRALRQDSVTADRFALVAEHGEAVPVSPWLFYGESSHNVLLVPGADLQDDADYTLAVSPGIETVDGHALADAMSISFSTGEPPAPLPPQPTGCGGGATMLLILPLSRRRRG